MSVYVFATVDNSIDPVSVKRGTTPPKVLNRGGGWEVVSRARRKGYTQWSGAEPARMAVPILFDGWHGRDSMEIDIASISRMALPAGDNKEPPLVTVRPGLPIVGLQWVIQGIEWGDTQIWDRDRSGSLSRMRQDATVTLLEHVSAEVIKANPDAPSSPGKPQTTPKLYTVKAGDSLSSIAVSLFGDRSLWPEIAGANDLRDANSVLAGQILRIPSV